MLVEFSTNDEAPVQLLEWPIRTNGHRSINSVCYIKAVLAFRAVLTFPLI